MVFSIKTYRLSTIHLRLVFLEISKFIMWRFSYEIQNFFNVKLSKSFN